MTLNEYNYLQSRFSRKLKKPDYTSKNAGYKYTVNHEYHDTTLFL